MRAPLCALCAAALVAALFWPLCACAGDTYQKACEAYASGDYDTAVSLCEELGDYKDAPALLEKARLCADYEEAAALMEAGAYARAASLWADLGDFKDSAEQLKRARYWAVVAYVLENGTEDAGGVARLSYGNACGGVSGVAADGETLTFSFGLERNGATLTYELDCVFEGDACAYRIAYALDAATLSETGALNPGAYREGDALAGVYAYDAPAGGSPDVETAFLSLADSEMGDAVRAIDVTLAHYGLDYSAHELGFVDF